MYDFFGVQRKAQRRNGATAQGGAVPSQEGATPQRDAGAMKLGGGIPCIARSPLRGAPRATLRGAPFQGVANNTVMRRKNCAIPPRSELTKR
ncbi:MAG: hypothetical protein ABI167_05080 [Nitrosospira sp.]